MTARLLRWLLVDVPQQLGAAWVLAIHLAGAAVAAWLVTVAWQQPYLTSLAVAAVSGGTAYVAGVVWRWRIRVQRVGRPDRWREREARSG